MKTRHDTIPEIESFDYVDPTRLVVDGFDLLQMAEAHDRAAIQEFFIVSDDWFLQEAV